MYYNIINGFIEFYVWYINKFNQLKTSAPILHIQHIYIYTYINMYIYKYIKVSDRINFFFMNVEIKQMQNILYKILYATMLFII